MIKILYFTSRFRSSMVLPKMTPVGGRGFAYVNLIIIIIFIIIIIITIIIISIIFIIITIIIIIYRSFLIIYGTPQDDPGGGQRAALRDLAVYIANTHVVAYGTHVRVLTDLEYKSGGYVVKRNEHQMFHNILLIYIKIYIFINLSIYICIIMPVCNFLNITILIIFIVTRWVCKIWT
jgi:hypothetical protein